MRRMKYRSHGRNGAQSSSSATASTSPEQANLEAENQRLRKQLQQQHRDRLNTSPIAGMPRENLTPGNPEDTTPPDNQFPPNWIT